MENCAPTVERSVGSAGGLGGDLIGGGEEPSRGERVHGEADGIDEDGADRTGTDELFLGEFAAGEECGAESTLVPGESAEEAADDAA